MLIGKSYALFFCHIISKYKKGENNMKTILLIIMGLICFCAVSSWEYSTSLEERMNTIPDSVYEYIILKLGDDATNLQILSYYDNHRIECDQIELENMN